MQRRGIAYRTAARNRTTMLRRLRYPFVLDCDRDGDRESRVQLLQLGLESAVDLVILFGAVAHDEDMRDLFLHDEPAGPLSCATLGFRVRLVEERLDAVQAFRALGRQDLIGIRPNRLRWRSAFHGRHIGIETSGRRLPQTSHESMKK